MFGLTSSQRQTSPSPLSSVGVHVKVVIVVVVVVIVVVVGVVVVVGRDVDDCVHEHLEMKMTFLHVFASGRGYQCCYNSEGRWFEPS